MSLLPVHPLRPLIRLDDPAYTRPCGAGRATVFIPGAWVARPIWLVPGPGQAWERVRTALGDARPCDGRWRADAVLQPGAPQVLQVSGGTLVGAVLQAADPVHIAALAGPTADGGRLRLIVHLEWPAGAWVAEPVALRLLVTDQGGRLLAVREQPAASGVPAVALDLPAPAEPGPYRLKALLTRGQQVADEACCDIIIPETNVIMGGYRAWTPSRQH